MSSKSTKTETRQFSQDDIENTNARMRQLASLSILMAPELQIAPRERQRARHQQIASNPAREAVPRMSPMVQRQLEASRIKEIELERDKLRDDIVKELEEKYLINEREYLFPERSRHFDLHSIQFPAKPFLPVEVSEDGQGLVNFPRIIEHKSRCKKRVPDISPRGQDTEVSTVLHGSDPTSRFASKHGNSLYNNANGAYNTNGSNNNHSNSNHNNGGDGGDFFPPNNESPRHGAAGMAAHSKSPANSVAMQDYGEQLDAARKMQFWKKQQKMISQRVQPTSIFDAQYNNMRSGASSIETKHGVPKSRTRALVPLTGINASDATGLGAIAPNRAGRRALFERAPELREERQRNAAAFMRHEQQRTDDRTEYQKMSNESARVPRGPVIPVRGTFFNPPVTNPRNREVVTHGADIVELSPRRLPVDSGRRIQIASTAATAVP